MVGVTFIIIVVVVVGWRGTQKDGWIDFWSDFRAVTDGWMDEHTDFRMDRRTKSEEFASKTCLCHHQSNGGLVMRMPIHS